MITTRIPLALEFWTGTAEALDLKAITSASPNHSCFDEPSHSLWSFSYTSIIYLAVAQSY